MTFLAAETYHIGAPVELYEFNYTGANPYRYTSADEDILDGATVYEARAIKRGDIQFTADIGKASLEIQAQRDLPVTELFKAGIPSGVITLTIKRKHLDDVETAVIWKGRVINVEWSQTEVTIICEPIRTALQSYGLRRVFQRQCPFVLYGVDCKVNNTAFKAQGAVSGMSATTITLPAAGSKPNNYYAGGYVQWTNPVTNTQERRSIQASVGSTGVLTLQGAITGLSVGMTVEAFPGCDKSLTSCHAKFGNRDNFGGFPHTPTKNPFNGTPMY